MATLYPSSVRRRLNEKVGEYPSALDFGAVGDARHVSDASITAGTAILESNTAAFVAGDVGKTVIVAGADSGGNPLVATISAVNSAASVTISANAVTTVTAAFLAIGTDDKAAIQAGIDALPEVNCGLYFPRKKYLIVGTLDAGAKKLSLVLECSELITSTTLFSATADTTFQADDGGSVSIKGMARDNCRILAAQSAGNVVGTSMTTSSTFSNFTVECKYSSNTATALRFSNAYLLDVEHVWVYGAYNGIHVTGGGGASGGFSNVVSIDNVSVREFLNNAVLIDHCNDCTIYNFHCYSATPRNYGMVLDTHAAGVYMQTMTLSNCGMIIRDSLDVGEGTYQLPPQFIFANQLICDFGPTHGLTFDDTLYSNVRASGASARSMHFTDCWFVGARNAGTYGLYIGGGFDLSFTDCRVRNNNYHGIYIKQFNEDLRFCNVISAANNFDNQSDGSALYIESTVGSVHLQILGGAYGGRIAGYETQATGGELYGNSKYGVYSNSTSVHLTMIGANLSRNETAPFGGFYGDKPIIWGNVWGTPNNLGTATNVTGATNASPIVITSTAHGLATGDRVRVALVGGNTAANGDQWVTVVDANNVSLDGTTGNGAYTSGGTITKLTIAINYNRVFNGEKIRYEIGDSNFYLDFSSSFANDPLIGVDANDYLHYDRDTNQWRWNYTGSAVLRFVGATGTDAYMGIQFRPVNAADFTVGNLINSSLDSDAAERFNIRLDGRLSWGDGTTADVSLARSSASTLTLTGGLTVTGALTFQDLTVRDTSGDNITQVVFQAGTSQAANSVLTVKDSGGTQQLTVSKEGYTSLATLGVGQTAPSTGGYLHADHIGAGIAPSGAYSIYASGTAVIATGDFYVSSGNIILTGATASRPCKFGGSKELVATQINLGDTNDIAGTVAVANGGTGATTAANARTNLGAAATSHNHSGADITSGSVAVANGGTGATDATGARANLSAAANSHTHTHSDITDGASGTYSGTGTLTFSNGICTNIAP